MQSVSIFFFIFILCTSIDPLEWKLEGAIRNEGFSTIIYIGTKSTGAPLQAFTMYLDLETSATLIPSVHCEQCKSGARYDREVSQTEEVISCSASYCDKHNTKYCPDNHSSQGQCCANFETQNCGWDSRVGKFSSSYYAEGTIVRDEFVFSSNRFYGYFVDVFNSTFEDIPGTAVGILGLGEKSCNPTCIDPIYNSVHESITWASNLFTMCFGLTNGVLAIGTNDRRFQAGTALYTKQRPDELGYTYDILDLRMDNRTFLKAGQKFVGVLKSNKNFILLPEALYKQWQQYMVDNYGDLEGVKSGSIFVGVPITNLTSFPPFDILVSGILFHIPPEQYFLQDEISSLAYELGIRKWDDENIGLGLLFMRGFVTIFDQENTGFAPANKENCLGKDDVAAVGSVEWAPTVEPVNPKPSYFIWLIVALAALIIIVIVCVVVIIYLRKSQKNLVKKYEGNQYLTMPLTETIVCIVCYICPK